MEYWEFDPIEAANISGSVVPRWKDVVALPVARRKQYYHGSVTTISGSKAGKFTSSSKKEVILQGDQKLNELPLNKE